MARLSKKAQNEKRMKEQNIAGVTALLFSIYYFFISLRSADPVNSTNPLDSFGIIGGFFLRTFTQLFGGYDLVVITFLAAFSIFALLSKEVLEPKKSILYVILIPLILGLLHLRFLESGDTFNQGFSLAVAGYGAGMTGFIVAFVYVKLFGTVASYLVSVMSIILILLYLTDFPFVYMTTKVKEMFSFTKKTVHQVNDSAAKATKAIKKQDETVSTTMPEAEQKEKDIIPIINNLDFSDSSHPRQTAEKAEEKKEIPAESSTDAFKVISIEEKKKEKLKKQQAEEPEAVNETFLEKEMEAELDQKSKQVLKKQYEYPGYEILHKADKHSKMDQHAINQRVHILQETLENFGVKGKISEVSCGPAITRYEFQPAPGVKVSKIVNLSDDIALSMATAGVRIAPIAGKNAIGIEVPNKHNSSVVIRSVLESTEFKKNQSKLSVALGKDIAGKPIVADLKKMPHLLIAGATGSGKSVCMNSVIASILFNASPDEVKLIMIDPKMVELTVYNGIPHLITPVVTDPKKAASALRWAVKEMENRYQLFSVAGVKSVEIYNENAEKNEEPDKKLPYIVVLIDELSDLMMVAPADVEDAICRIAQMARAAGIHLVIATQRPSVNVITGIIKANVPSRIAFAVSSQVDSRTILDMNGAEKLLGKGDMLYYPSGVPKPFRVQGVFITDDEIETLVMEIKSKGVPKYDDGVTSQQLEITDEESKEETDDDELVPEAAKLFIENGQASISLLQRRFRIGYNRAARIIDQMEQKGIVGGYEGSKPRQILINLDDYDQLFGK